MVAIPIAGLLAIVAALIALLVLYGAKVLTHFIAQLLPSWHLFGFGNLRNVVQGAADGALNAVAGWFDARIEPLANFLMSPVHAATALYERIVQAIAATRATVEWIVQTYVPREFKRVAQISAGTVASLQAYARKWAHAASADATKLYYRTKAETAALIAATRAYALSAAKAVEHDADALYYRTRSEWQAGVAAARAAASASIGVATRALNASIARAAAVAHAETVAVAGTLQSAEADLSAAIRAAESAAVAGAIGIIDTDIAHVGQAVAAGVTDAVDAAVGAAAGEFGDILDWVRAIPREAVTDIAGVTAISTAVAGALARYLERCGLPNCRNLSKVGRDLQSLFTLVEDGVLLAALVEMIADPEGAARELRSILAGPVDALTDGARSLLGVSR
jgi:hypothetical protein